MFPPPCIHEPNGLCPACQEEFDADPEAWLEYGCHQDGIRRSRELQEEIEAWHAAQPALEPRADHWADIPF